jgi:CYTH domain-containing protein
MTTSTTPQVFIAHANEDELKARELFAYLEQSGFDPWLDKKKLLPGQNWRDEIPKALKKSDFFIACLSSQSVSKKGYIQREFKQALNLLAEMPTGTIYLIPLKLDECEVPDLRQNEYGVNLRDIQWLNYWEEDGYEKLILSIRHQWDNMQSQNSPTEKIKSSASKINLSEINRLEQVYSQLDKEAKELLNIIAKLRSELNHTASAVVMIELERQIKVKEDRYRECVKELKLYEDKIKSIEKM